MHQLDFTQMQSVDDEIIIPYRNNPCARIRISNNQKNIIAEYEDVEFYWNERTNTEEEHWCWRRAYNQPDEDERKIMLEELNRYAEDKGHVPCQMC